MAWLAQHLSLVLFVVLALALFCGYPVAFVLGGIAIFFGGLGILLDVFQPVQFFNLLPRSWGGVAANPILVAVPMFIFMGTVLERSGVANDLLHCLQILTRRVPGGLAISVTLMGTIMAAPRRERRGSSTGARRRGSRGSSSTSSSTVGGGCG